MKPSMLLFLVLGVMAGLAPAAASADEREQGTIARMLATRTINLGHRESSAPFSYYDQRGQVVGYSQDLMLKVVETLRLQLKLPWLTVKLVPVTPQNRIPLVQNGTVDLECASTTHNLERERQVAFSTSFFLIGTRLMTARDSGIQDFPDLPGRRVVVTSGTTSERLLRVFNERMGGRLAIVLARDHGESFHLLEAGRVDAFMMDDALLYGERAKSATPERWVVVGQPMSTEAYGCMMRRDDPAFKAIVDRALVHLMEKGEALALYRKWFQQPIPPRNLNLDWPPSDELLKLYRQPNDEPHL